jgi:hypothetical protein
MMSTTFWDKTPCSPLKINRISRACLPLAFTLISWSAYSIMKMEALCSSEKSVDFQRTAWRYIPTDINLL